MEFINYFEDELNLSLSLAKHDMDLLKKIIPYCVDVQKTTAEVDKTGVDYIATLSSGARINIDAKTREKGSSKFWRHGEPELVLEIFGRIPDKNGKNGKLGWTLDRSTNVDYILYTFDKSDSDKYYFIPFQMLRTAFIQNHTEWEERYEIKEQLNEGYVSKAMFVPASIVISAVANLMEGEMTGKRT